MTAYSFILKLKSNLVRSTIKKWKRLHSKNIMNSYSKYPTTIIKRTRMDIRLALKTFCIIKLIESRKN